MNVDSLISQIEPQLPSWFEKQRWFSSSDEGVQKAKVIDSEMLGSGDTEPHLFWLLVEADGATYQVPVGLRTVDTIGGILLGHEHAQIGKLKDDQHEYLVYDALIDPELGLLLLAVVSDGQQTAQAVRPIGAEQSNTSLIYDNRLIVKFFRRLHKGTNPDLEVTAALTERNTPHIAPVLARWQRGEWDLAFGQPYLYDGTDGWKLALASIRDYLGADTTGASSPAGSPLPRIMETGPAAAGGDFADEAHRIGEMTGSVLLAMSQVFDTQPFNPSTLADSLERDLTTLDDARRPALQALITKVRAIEPGNAGVASRVHGDYHLGQTLRSVSGWYMFDFEGEPARPLAERTLPNSPFKDVAGMLRSFHYAAASGLLQQMEVDQDEMRAQADAWEQHNREAFRDGFLGVPGIDALLPTGDSAQLLLEAFEVEKALYELAYEKAYRPDWIEIPQSAIDRLLAQ